MTRHLHIDLRPNLNDQLVEAEWAQKEVGRHSRLSSLRDRAAARLAALRFNPGRKAVAWEKRPRNAHHLRLDAKTRSVFAKTISGDCFFLVTGAMVALDLCLVVWLVQR